jgi:hypothetical protein
MSTETADTGNSSKTPEACRREAEEDKLKTAVEHGGAQINQVRTKEQGKAKRKGNVKPERGCCKKRQTTYSGP